MGSLNGRVRRLEDRIELPEPEHRKGGRERLRTLLDGMAERRRAVATPEEDEAVKQDICELTYAIRQRAEENRRRRGN